MPPKRDLVTRLRRWRDGEVTETTDDLIAESAATVEYLLDAIEAAHKTLRDGDYTVAACDRAELILRCGLANYAVRKTSALYAWQVADEKKNP